MGLPGHASPQSRGLKTTLTVEKLADDGFVDKTPKMFAVQAFRSIGRQGDEPQTVRHAQSGFGVPAGSVEEAAFNPT